MKSSLIALSFLFLSCLPDPLLGAPEPLYDIVGNEVVTGTQYYITAVIGLANGSLSLEPGRNNLCPLDVFIEGQHLESPALLFPFNYTVNSTTVYESTDLNIQFNNSPPTCSNYSTVWKVDNYDGERGAWFITTNGVIGNPGPQTLLNWFKFEKASEVQGLYHIVHCPSVCDSCVKLCSNVSVSLQNERRLVLSQPYNLSGFVFVTDNGVQYHKERLNAII